ncbi:MAG: oxidoreductase [Phycisphaerae bacterium]|nr:oxidoreductase [Phycisphaerae bacterium]
MQKILSNTEISPGVFLLSIKRQVEFLPGQTVKLSLDNDLPPRIYSICSGTGDAQLSVLYNIKKDGALTPRLAGLSRGDAIRVSEPGGTFIGTAEPALWIATGTGIAPFYSMLRSGLGHNKTLLHGVRYANQFYFHTEWEQQLGDRYHRFCSGEGPEGIAHGRVNRFFEQTRDPLPDRVYICGQATMCVEIRDLLIARGIPFGNILCEIYF